MMKKNISKKKVYRAGIIGCGRIAHLFASDGKRPVISTHAQAYQADEHYDLIAAADSNPDRLSGFGKKWHTPHLYESYEELFREQQLDVVSICTPTQTHYEVASAAIENGVRAIFCEKPLTHTMDEAKRLQSLILKHEVVFAVNHARRWDTYLQSTAQFIREEVGCIQSVDAYYTGGIANTGSHMIDMIHMLTQNRVQSVRILASHDESNDPTVDAQLSMIDGANYFLHGLRAKDFVFFELDICGTKGRVRVENHGFDIRFWKTKPHKRYSGLRGYQPAFPDFGTPNQHKFENALKNIRASLEGNALILSDFNAGQAALEVILAIRESNRQQGEEVVLPFVSQIRA